MLFKSTLKILCVFSSASWVSSSISGISFMDPLVQKPKPLPGENPCNPLYWYPRHIPDYCYNKVEEPAPPKPPISQTLPPVAPIPMPPVALPMPIPFPIYPMPMFPSAVPQFIPPAPPQFIPQMSIPQMPIPQMPMHQMPVPYGIPQAANPMMPMLIPAPYPPAPQKSGLVPGIPGLVSQDGGINILPFSDAYSDMLEKYKQKMIRKRLQKILDDYDDFPRRHKQRKYRG